MEIYHLPLDSRGCVGARFMRFGEINLQFQRVRRFVVLLRKWHEISPFPITLSIAYKSIESSFQQHALSIPIKKWICRLKAARVKVSLSRQFFVALRKLFDDSVAEVAARNEKLVFLVSTLRSWRRSRACRARHLTRRIIFSFTRRSRKTRSFQRVQDNGRTRFAFVASRFSQRSMFRW